MIADSWTPAQAAAAWELLDDLREQIWLHYGQQIQAHLQQERAPTNDAYPPLTREDPPF